MKAPSPAFSFYPKDVLGDETCAAMTDEEFGVYARLLCHAWLEGSIPADHVKLQRLMRRSSRSFARIWPAIAPCWTEAAGRLYQKRLEEERVKQLANSGKQRDRVMNRWKPSYFNKSSIPRNGGGSTAVVPDGYLPSPSASAVRTTTSQESLASLPRTPLREHLLSAPADVAAVFERWKERLEHPEAKLSPKREKLIRARLKDSTVDELFLAIDGCKASPFHQGDNERGKVFDDIALICRDREHVEQFMREAPPPEPTEAELEARLAKERERDQAEGRAKREAYERERDAALAMPYPDELPK